MSENLQTKLDRIEKEFNLKKVGMITYDQIDSIKLHKKPFRQRIPAGPLTGINLSFLPCIDVQFLGTENIPKEGGKILVMNHSDAYNYLPLIRKLYQHDLYPAVWIKGKNYVNRFASWFFDFNGMIPVPPGTYVIEKAHAAKYGKGKLTKESYALIKELFNEKKSDEIKKNHINDKKNLPADVEFFAKHIDDLSWYQSQLLQRMGKLTEDALDLGLYILCFPEGTRNAQLGIGRTGIFEVALHKNIPIIPVGCSNGNNVYPRGSLPFARGPNGFIPSFLPGVQKGKLIYRFGKEITTDDLLKECRIIEEYTPFSPESQKIHTQKFSRARDIVMQKLHDLLDSENQNKELYK